ncbi:hypothetical protein ACFQ3Z_46390 [Streptomyces nogalater]
MGLSRNSANTAMALLESRNLVLRPKDRKYRTYYLHPYIASYASQEELEEAIEDAAERIDAANCPRSPPRCTRPRRPSARANRFGRSASPTDAVHRHLRAMTDRELCPCRRQMCGTGTHVCPGGSTRRWTG